MQNEVARAAILVVAMIWAYAMLIATVKHQYFVGLQKKRLMMMEYFYMGVEPLQRFTHRDTLRRISERALADGDEKSADLWSQIYEAARHWEFPHGFLERQSAHKWLKRSILVNLLTLSALEAYTVLSVILGLLA
ncbi:MAG TPA: hypothetical protein ENF78_01290 [Candidatus Bathyarchaeota archaeon]|nr:hypothetical protein [Candidatus Bathyarchaeota archaeon]